LNPKRTTDVLPKPDNCKSYRHRLGLPSIGELPLGRQKVLRASFDQIDGQQRLHLRRWRYDIECRAMRPTSAGFLVNVSQLPQFYDLIGRALAQARRDGLVGTGAIP
jgi:hypothetical protein